MAKALVEALRDSRGYMQDQGWHQTAGLMTLAADEIQRLTARVQELEGATCAESDVEMPTASNQNGVHVAAVSSRR